MVFLVQAVVSTLHSLNARNRLRTDAFRRRKAGMGGGGNRDASSMTQVKRKKATKAIFHKNEQEVPAVHHGPPKMPSKLNPPKYRFHRHRCTDHELNGQPDQLSHPTPNARNMFSVQQKD